MRARPCGLRNVIAGLKWLFKGNPLLQATLKVVAV